MVPPVEQISDGTVRMERTIGLLGGISLILGTMIVTFTYFHFTKILEWQNS